MASLHGERTAILAGRKTAARSFLGVPANRFWAGIRISKTKKTHTGKKFIEKKKNADNRLGRAVGAERKR